MKYLYLLLFISVMFSCTKPDAVNSNNIDQEHLKKLVLKYNLKATNVKLDSINRKFSTIEDFENFLIKQEDLFKQKPSGRLSFYPGQPNSPTDMEIPPYSGKEPRVYYGVSIVFDYTQLGDLGYPNFVMLKFQWQYNAFQTGFTETSTQVKDVNLNMIRTGSNFGSTNYYQLNVNSYPGTYSGTATGKINVNGVYTETYSVGGIYTYTKRFRARFECNYVLFGNGTTATMIYEPF